MAQPRDPSAPMSRAGAFGLLLGLLFGTPASADREVNVEIENFVVNCIEIKLGRLYREGHLHLLETGWQVKMSTAECGCKSSLLSYRTIQQVNDLELNVATGVFSSLDREKFTIPLSADAQLSERGPYKLVIGCEAPA